MKITIVVRNEDQSHEEVDNIANLIEDMLEHEGFVNVKQEEFSTEFHITAETQAEEDEEGEE